MGEYKGQTYRKADMRAVISATESIVPHLRPGNLVVLESTSPPRTTVDLIQPILERSGMKAGVDFYLAYSPERVLPGQILRELLENARVIGGVNQSSTEAGRDLYACFVKGKIVLTDATTAEMVKLMENTSRDINIAIANEYSRLAQRFGIDVWEAIKIANLHPRVNILNPGPGVGGHCISVDPWFLVEAAPDLTKLILAARGINDSQPGFVLDLIRTMAGENLTGKHIAILGMAFKPDVDDLRESPAIEVIKGLTQAGAIVRGYEPNKKDAEISGIMVTQSLQEAVADAELVILLVAHREFKELTPQKLRELTPAHLLIDTVGCWAIQPWSEAGFKLGKLGVGQNE
jgi:UDP-N-acetyl-D-mannosaminuronic acid dehydrogenase